MTSSAPPQTCGKYLYREMLALGAGDFAAVLYWTTFMRFLPIFYTDVFGLTAAIAGSILLWSRLGDGVTDVIIGVWADRTESRWGKFRPFIIFGCVPFAVAGVLTFTTPDLGDPGKIIWAAVTYNLLMILYTTFNIPQTSLLGVLTNDPRERARLSSAKFFFAFSAGFVISVTLLPAVDLLGGTDNPQLGWQLAYTLIGVIAVVLLLLNAFGVTERIKPTPDPEASLRKDLGFLVRNRAWLVVLGTTLLWILFIALRSSVSSHYFKYYIFDGDLVKTIPFLGFEFNFTSLTSAFFGVGQATAVVTVLVMMVFADRFAKKPLFIVLLGIQIAATAAYYVLEPGQLGAIFLLEILGNVGGAAAPVLLWAMYAEAADYGEWKFGRRTTALVFSASTMSQKFGWGIAAWLGLQTLAWAGFVANETPNDDVRQSLVALMSIVPSIFGILAIVVFLFYPLNEARMLQINAEIAARKNPA